MAPLLDLVSFLVALLELLIVLLADVDVLSLYVEVGGFSLGYIDTSYRIVLAVLDGALLALGNLTQCNQVIASPLPHKASHRLLVERPIVE